MKTTNIQAFSLIEVLVTMIIAVLVMSTAISGYLFIEKQYYSFQKEEDKLLVIAQVNDCLQRDFAHAKSVEAIGNDLLFKFIDDTEIIYTIGDNGITRNIEAASEAFKVDVESYQVFYNKANLDAEWIILDELIVALKQDKLHYLKTYGADFKIEYEQLKKL